MTCVLRQLTGPIQMLDRSVYREVMYVPKWPKKRASRHEVISGIHPYNTKMAGIRRRKSIPQVNTANRHGMISRSGMVNALNGNHAPIYTKQAQLRRRSMTEAKASSSVWSLKLPSHETAVPNES